MEEIESNAIDTPQLLPETDVIPAAEPTEAKVTPPTDDDKAKDDVAAFEAGVKSIKDPSLPQEPPHASPKKEASATSPKPAGDGKQPGAEKPVADPSAQTAKDPKQPDADLEKEITGLALKGKAAERFREMAGEIKATRPMMETLKGLQVQDQQQLNTILKDAAAGLQWEKAVMDSTAKPEQLSSALQIIKAMNANDPKLRNMALDAMLAECKNVAEQMGREIPGITGDALDKHPDLKQAVEAMDMTREHALEVVKHRATTNVYQQRDEQQRQNSQQREAQQQAEASERLQIDELSETLKASDPHFGAKLAAMQQSGAFANINALPVGQRYKALLSAYRAIPTPVAPSPSPVNTPRVRPGPVANRGNNTSATGVARATFANDVEAFEFGVAQASRRS